MRKLAALFLVTACVVPLAALARPAIIAIILPCTQNQQTHVCKGKGMTKLGSKQVAYSFTMRPSADKKKVDGPLTLRRRDTNYVMLGTSARVFNGDLDGDRFTAKGVYRVLGGQGALKDRFASAASKKLVLSAQRNGAQLTVKLSYTGLE